MSRQNTAWKLRHLVFGSFIAAFRARRGRGVSKPQQVWEEEFRSGSWDFLESMEERSHHMVVLGYVLGVGDNKSVLDVGCATGGLLHLARKFQLSQYTGIDIAPTAIESARERFRDTNIRFPVVFEVADFESFVPSRRYDVIIFNETLSYTRDPVALVTRFRDFLTPDGVFLVSLCYNWWQEPIMKRLTAAFQVRNSADIINEEGLTWQVRLLSPNQSSIRATAASARSDSGQLSSLRSEIAERSVMVSENFRAVFKGMFAMFLGRNATK